MKTYIFPFIFFILSFFNLYSQEKTYKNFFELEELMKDTAYKSEEKSEDHLDREYWFLSTRYDSAGTLGGYVNAINSFYLNLNELIQKNSSTLKKTSSLSTLSNTSIEDLSWNYLGPKGLNFHGNLSQSVGSIGRGWINAIKVINADSIYAGARNSGLWFTSDGGDSWSNISESEPLINGIYSILIDPNDPEHIVLLTGRVTAGELEFNQYSNGIFETFDHGVTWNKVTVLIDENELFPTVGEWEFPVKLIHHPMNFNELFLLNNSSLYRRVNGTDWDRIYQNNMYNGWNNDIIFDKQNSNVFYIGGAFIYKMTITQNGINRQDITNEVTGEDTIRRCMIGISDIFPNKIWYYYMSRNGSKHLVNYENSNYSNTWNVSGSGERTMQIVTSPNDSTIVYLGKVTPAIFNQSTSTVHDIASNALASNEEASDITDFLHADIRAMNVLTVGGIDRLYVGHDGGVAWGEDGNGSCNNMYCWHQISDDGTNGLQTNEFYGISISHSENLVIQGGTQDCSSFVYDESSNLWYHVYFSDGLEGAVSCTHPGKFITGGGVSRSYSYRLYDMGNSQYYNDFKVTGGTLNNRIKPDPSNDDIIYIGADQLYKISNSFSTPSAVTINTPVSSSISAFAIGINNSDIKYVAETMVLSESGDNRDHMWRYEPSISSWIEISSNISQYNYSYATDIVLNPLDDYELWMSMGTANHGSNKVLHSSDGGETWDILNTGYPSGITANRLLYDQVLNSLFVATDVGIFRWDLSDPSLGWLYLSNTMPFKLVTDIEKDEVNHRLIAGTYGRGIWEAQLPEDTCYDADPLYISTAVTWNQPNSFCRDIYVQNGGQLTITSNITLSPGRTLFVEDGGTVVIDGGHLLNGNTVIYEGAGFTISNNGSVTLSHGDNFSSDTGSLININYGAIIKN